MTICVTTNDAVHTTTISLREIANINFPNLANFLKEN
jgi:hypothetical protein